MVWQDIVITCANIVFTIALVPQVYYGFKQRKGLIAFTSSIPTFICLYLMAFTYFTLDFYFATAMTTATGTLWLILFIQRLAYGKA